MQVKPTSNNRNVSQQRRLPSHRQDSTQEEDNYVLPLGRRSTGSIPVKIGPKLRPGAVREVEFGTQNRGGRTVRPPGQQLNPGSMEELCLRQRRLHQRGR